jgi:hypothetical protein
LERIQKAKIATLSISIETKRKKEKKGHNKEEKKINTVQMIQNMVLESIKCESVSLFTIILGDVKH